MRKLVFLFLIAAIFLSMPVNAEIFISQPQEVYSLNDLFSVNVSLKESSSISGLLQVSIVCPAKTVVFYADGSIKLAVNKVQDFFASWKISGVSGQCHVKAEFESEIKESGEFLVTSRIDASLELNKQYLEPDEILIIKGKATKANSIPVEGFAEITVSDIVKSQYVNVEQGSFNAQIKLPSNIPAKEYMLQAIIFEKNERGDTTNNGAAEIKFNVIPVPSKLDLSISDEKFLPGKTVALKTSLYDQSLQVIKENISVRIKDSEGRNAIDRLVGSGENFEYKLEQNAIPGEWQIESSILDFKAKRTVYVESYEAADISLEGDKIIARNIGNVQYAKPLEVRFVDADGIEQTKIQDIKIDVGKDIALKLSAPDGVYNIEVADRRFTSVPLTGAVAASVRIEKNPGILAQYPAISIPLFFLFLLLLVLFLHRATRETIRVGSNIPVQVEKPVIKTAKPAQKPIISAKPGDIKQVKPGEDITIIPQLTRPVKTAETALVLQGQKQNASVLYFKTKNIPELQGKISALALESLKNFAERTVINSVENHNGAVHRLSDTEILAIFAPMQRNFRHEIAAVKAAAKIGAELKEHNRKFKARLDFGIGVNSGELILSFKRVLQYTSIGKTIVIARKLAERASQEAIISKDIYSRVMSEVKTRGAGSVMVGDEGIECYIIEGISGREAYSSYINDVLRRIK